MAGSERHPSGRLTCSRGALTSQCGRLHRDGCALENVRCEAMRVRPRRLRDPGAADPNRARLECLLQSAARSMRLNRLVSSLLPASLILSACGHVAKAPAVPTAPASDYVTVIPSVSVSKPAETTELRQAALSPDEGVKGCVDSDRRIGVQLCLQVIHG